jgi:predicted transport protein
MSGDAIKQAMENQVKNLEEKTGKKIDEWIKIVQNSKLEKHGELVNMLKEKYGIGHGYANMVVHTAKQSHAGFAEEEDLINEQYKGKESLRPWYDALMKIVKSLGKDVEVSPKKAYVSLRRKKQFAIIQPSTKTRLDVGLNLKDVTPSGKLEAAGSWNGMCSHRVKIEDATQVDAEVAQWLKTAYEQAG